jgi:chromosomal replication initiator protein
LLAALATNLRTQQLWLLLITGRHIQSAFIYGGVGLGKSHLLNAIGHTIRSNSPNINLCYCSAEKFMYEMVNALRQKRMEQFRERFRKLDVLLIDDIQFISGKVGTQ